MPRRSLSVVSRMTEEERLRFRRLRDIEEILRSEFEAAQLELDHVIQMTIPGRVNEALERSIQATRRLRQFLALGDVPADVLQRLDETA